ncbi:MAG: 4'-phosphopantetheinyl transferase superfamily protein [Ilumatobacteraceae bacterium]
MTHTAAAVVHWLQRRLHDLPDGDGWLSTRERTVQDRLVVPKRRADWRLGRWTAKALVAAVLDVEVVRVSIIAAPDGAPEALVDELPAPISLSISHRAGVGLAAVGEHVVVGGDLEVIEPRSPAFVREWFGEHEQALIAEIRDPRRRDELTCLLWSVKEASAKVLREGLRLDPRGASVVLDDDRVPDEPSGHWQRSTVRWATEGRVVSGWWRVDGSFVRAIAGDRPTDVPQELR